MHQPFEASSHLELLKQKAHLESFSARVASIQGHPELCRPGVSLVSSTGTVPGEGGRGGPAREPCRLPGPPPGASPCALAQVPSDDGRSLLLRSRLLHPEAHAPPAADRGAGIQRVLHQAAPGPRSRSAKPSVLVSPPCSLHVLCKHLERALPRNTLAEKIEAMFIHLSSDDQPCCVFVLIINAVSVVLYACHLLFLPNYWCIF